MPCGAQLEVVQASVQREDDIDVHDHADLEVRVLPILPRERIDEIIRRHLVEQGWDRAPDGTLTKKVGDALATLPPGSSTIRVTLSDETSVSITANVRENIQQGDEAARAAVNEKAQKQADAKLAEAADRARRELEAKTADKLLEAWRELRAEIDQVTNQVTREALEARAAELGSIESISDGKAKDGSYELTITVRT